MDDDHTGKRIEKVNAFKAPADWCEIVRLIAAKRHSTISSTIIRLVELGVPLYESLREHEPSVIAETLANYKTLHLVHDASTRHNKQAGKKGKSNK